MKHGIWLVLLIVLPMGCACADIVESFDVGSPFALGVAGLNPGSQISLDNSFATSPITGSVDARRARSILAGGGDVVFTTMADGSTQIHLNMGTEISTSSLVFLGLVGILAAIRRRKSV